MFRPALVALLLSVSLAACRKAPEPPAPPAAPAAPAAPEAAANAAPADAKPDAALKINGVDLGTAVGADGRIVTALESFSPSDTIIVAITVTNAGATPVNGTVTARWLDPEGIAFNEESRQQDYAGAQTVNFRVANPKGFKSGNYKLEVALNGSTVETREFAVH
jgi:hypothetical protein